MYGKPFVWMVSSCVGKHCGKGGQVIAITLSAEVLLELFHAVSHMYVRQMIMTVRTLAHKSQRVFLLRHNLGTRGTHTLSLRFYHDM